MFSNITDKIRLLFRKDKEPYLCFYKMLGFYPRNIEIYQQALLHKSSSIKAGKGRLLNNERLEFLGDAILDAIVADIVYKKFEGKREGFLTNTRSKIVQRETLNRVAVEIGLDKLIKYTTRQSSHNSYMCGNAFEALIGAIYLDRGYRTCKKFMEERIINQYLNLEKISRKEVNFKSKLIEWSQKNKFCVEFNLIERIINQYLNLEKISRKEVNFKSKLIEWSQKNKFCVEFNLIEQSLDSDQNPIFETQITVENIPAGTGKGYSKKESQQEAAHATLTKIKGDPQFIDAIFAAKAEREKTAETAESENTTAIHKEAIAVEESISVREEEIPEEHFVDTERIIAEAEEVAFRESK